MKYSISELFGHFNLQSTMFVELVDAATVMKDYIGIEDENLFLGRRHLLVTPFMVYMKFHIGGNHGKFAKGMNSSQRVNSGMCRSP